MNRTWCGTAWCSASSRPTTNMGIAAFRGLAEQGIPAPAKCARAATTRRLSQSPPASAHQRISASMILNRQRSIRIPIQDLEKFTERARQSLRFPADAFTVCLVTKGEIARWNLAYRGKKGPTDVLSFRNEETPGKPKGAKGGKTKTSSRKKDKGSATWPGREEDGYLGDIAI